MDRLGCILLSPNFPNRDSLRRILRDWIFSNNHHKYLHILKAFLILLLYSDLYFSSRGGFHIENESDCFYLGGPGRTFSINKDDKLILKLAMLIETRCLGIPVTEVVKKYGFSRSGFYQIKRAYAEGGSEALREGKRGPSINYKRTDTVVNQIIRHRFLDPDTSSDIITQKMMQVGYDISKRSIERAITEYGL